MGFLLVCDGSFRYNEASSACFHKSYSVGYIITTNAINY